MRTCAKQGCWTHPGDVGPPVGCEWLKHILRAAISVELRVKVRCEGVTGDEV